MTHVEKLIRKEFKIKTEEALLDLVGSKKEGFYEEQFLTSKEQYLKKIKQLIFKINDYGDVPRREIWGKVALSSSHLDGQSVEMSERIISNQERFW